MIERICVVLYEMSPEGRKIFRAPLAAYAISNHLEIIIKWLLPTAKEAEIASACIEAQIAFVNAGDTARAAQIGRLVYQANPDCALVYYGHCLPQDCLLYTSRVCADPVGNAQLPDHFEDRSEKPSGVQLRVQSSEKTP